MGWISDAFQSAGSGFIGNFLGGLGGMTAGLVGDLFGVEDQNDVNKKIARETNALNYQIWLEEMQYNQQMYAQQYKDNVALYKMQNQDNRDNWLWQFNQTNEYNSASAQRERLEAAGLNPYLMMSGGNAGVASSSSVPSASVSPAQMNASHPPTMQGYYYQSPWVGALKNAFDAGNAVMDLIGKGQSINQSGELHPITKSIMENTASKEALTASFMKDFGYRNAKNESDALNLSTKNFLKYGEKQADLDYTKQWLDYDNAMHNNQILRETKDDVIEQVKAGAQLSKLNVKQQTTLNKYLDGQQQLQLATMSQNLANMVAQEKLSWKQIDLAASQMFVNFCQANNIKSQTALNNQQFKFNEKTEDLKIAGMTQDNLGKYYQNEQSKYSLNALKQTFKDMVRSQIWQYKLNEINSRTSYNSYVPHLSNQENHFYSPVYNGIGSAFKLFFDALPFKSSF